MAPEDITLPQLSAGSNEIRARPNYARWRTMSLIGVHILIAGHIAHGYLTGRTLAPLELNEVMHTLERGIVTAAFIFMALIILSVAVFGRFFCSWGCHLLALQDGAAWILGRLGIRPKPMRSRSLLIIPIAAMIYMFLWPQLRRILHGVPAPTWRVAGPDANWASFVTDDFWRNLPGPWISILTLLTCGGVIVYLLGSRSFCQYICPYGAIFGLVDRVAPGRIKLTSDACTQCGLCTSVCESHVRVHEEIRDHQRVIDPACLKDLDCVSVCPENAIAFGMTRPSLRASFKPGRTRLPSDYSWAEEWALAVIFLANLVIYRGLYGRVPFLFALAIAAISAFLLLHAVRVVRRRHVRLNRFRLTRNRSTTSSGRFFIAVVLMLTLFTAHSAFIRFHEVAALSALAESARVLASDRDAGMVAGEKACRHLDAIERFGLVRPPEHFARSAAAHWAAGHVREAARLWSRAIDRNPNDHQSRLHLATVLRNHGDRDEVLRLLNEVADAHGASARDADRYRAWRSVAWQRLADLAVEDHDLPAAARAMKAAAAEFPENRQLRDAAERMDLNACFSTSTSDQGAGE